MEKKKNPGPIRKLLARYNTPLVWVFCGVLLVAQVDLVYKTVTGKIHRQNKSRGWILINILGMHTIYQIASFR